MGMFMFTGIITHLGKLKEKNHTVFTFTVAPAFHKRLSEGTSVAVNGACLSIVKKPSTATFSVELMPETLKKTTFATLKLGDLVNLELPATPETFLSGHIVQGHVDGVGKVTKVGRVENSKILTVTMPKALSRYIVSKASIAINGISLTVIEAKPASFTVGITPYTWRKTTLKTIKLGTLINIEVDIIAKYIHSLLNRTKVSIRNV